MLLLQLENVRSELHNQEDLISQLQKRLRISEESTAQYEKTVNDLLSEKVTIYDVRSMHCHG